MPFNFFGGSIFFIDFMSYWLLFWFHLFSYCQPEPANYFRCRKEGIPSQCMWNFCSIGSGSIVFFTSSRLVAQLELLQLLHIYWTLVDYKYDVRPISVSFTVSVLHKSSKLGLLDNEVSQRILCIFQCCHIQAQASAICVSFQPSVSLMCYALWVGPYPMVDFTISVNSCVCRSFLISYTWFMQHFMEGHAKSGPISRLPLVTISDSSNLLRDIPVCQVISW